MDITASTTRKIAIGAIAAAAAATAAWYVFLREKETDKYDFSLRANPTAVSKVVHVAGELKHRSHKWQKTHDFLAMTKQKILETFSKFDLDGDGKITKKELKTVLSKDPHARKLLQSAAHAAGYNFADDSAEGEGQLPALIVRELDLDGDGTIDKTEFFRKLYSEVHIVKIFHEYDQDEDGYLNEEEFVTMLAFDPELEIMLNNLLEDIVLSSLTSFIPLLNASRRDATKAAEDASLADISEGAKSMATRFFDELQEDNKVSLSAFLARLHLHSQVVSIYRSIDRDGDRDLCKAEVMAAIRKDKAFEDLVKKSNIRGDVFSKLDLDGDGSVSLEELISRLGKHAK